MGRAGSIALAAAVFLAMGSQAFAQEGNPARGQRLFQACAACHSLQPDRNMTGPSLSGVWHRKAGTLASFTRYSPALLASGITWDDNTLDQWIADPQRLVPGNQMTFPGIKNAQQRQDLIAFLKNGTQSGSHVAQENGKSGGMMGEMGGGMGGMMGGGQVPSLKSLDPEDRVRAIYYCKDTYAVTTADGKTRKFWERNLRLKTDSSSDGPEKDAPALVPAGMMGDRADVIFSHPDEIGRFIKEQCE